MIPARIEPPERAPSGLGFVTRFARNPLEVVPRAAYEEDFVPGGEGLVPRAWVTAPELVKAVLLDERDKFRKLTQIRLLGPLLGKGILTSEGPEWKWQRQAASPMFRPGDLLGYVPVFVRAAEEEVARWRSSGRSTIAVDEAMTRTTFEVICATLLPSSDARLGASIQRSLAGFQASGGWELMFAALNLPRWLPRPWALGARRAAAELRGAVEGLLRARRASSAPPPDDLMQRLIAARDPETGRAMDDARLVDNLLTFYLAGHETTAKALTWTLYLLSRSSQWSAALEEEVARVTGGAPLAPGHVERLALVQQVVKESMRLYPPVPLMSRQAVAPVTLAGRAISPGTSVLLPIYAIHRHRARWQDPDTFDPARFAPEREEAMPRYQFMPFGAGPRVCIGRSFALVEATAILATLVRHARFEPAAEPEPVPVARVTLMPKGGMRLKAALR